MHENETAATQSGGSGLNGWMLLAILIAVGAVLFAFRSPLRNSASTSAMVGTKLTTLQLEPLTGDAKAVTLDDLRGQVALVNIWGTWCPPCRAEFPHIVELAKHYQDTQGFQLLAVSSGGGNDGDGEIADLKTDTEEFLRAEGATIPTYVDRNGVTRAAIPEFGGYPTTLLLDRQGVIRGYWQGYEPGAEHEMRKQIDELLAEGGVGKRNGKQT